jgi:iron complex outermembrane receptor protein
MIDPLAARYATIARGANAMSYGASTLGGAVNFVTPTARDGARDRLLMSAGSHGQLIGRLTLARVFNESADGLLTIEGKRWDGYREHNEQDRGGVYGNAGWQFSNGWSTRFYLTAIHNDSELTSPLSRDQFDNDPDQANPAAIGNFQVDVDTVRLANKTIWDIDTDRRLELGLSIEEQSLFHPIVWSPFFSLLIDTDHRDLGTMLRYYQQAGAHELVAGLNYGKNRSQGGHFSHIAGEPTELWATVRNSASTAELFVMDRWQIATGTTLELAAQAVSARRDAMNTQVPSGLVNNPEARYEHVNPRVGVIRALADGVSLYANLSGIYEPPTNFELEDNVAGNNATLDAMRGTVAEFGFRGGQDIGTGTVNWELSLYRAEIRDEILSIDDPLAPGTSLTTNVDRTVHAGIEAMFRSTHPIGNRGLSLEPLVTLTINDFSFDGDAAYGDNDLPVAPDVVARGELIFRSPRGFFAGPTFDHVGDRWADFANTYRIDSYTVLGLRGGFTQDNWRVYLDVRNLADNDYVAYSYVRNVAPADAAILFPGEPLSAYLGLEISFD